MHPHLHIDMYTQRCVHTWSRIHLSQVLKTRPCHVTATASIQVCARQHWAILSWLNIISFKFKGAQANIKYWQRPAFFSFYFNWRKIFGITITVVKFNIELGVNTWGEAKEPFGNFLFIAYPEKRRTIEWQNSKYFDKNVFSSTGW